MSNGQSDYPQEQQQEQQEIELSQAITFSGSKVVVRNVIDEFRKNKTKDAS